MPLEEYAGSDFIQTYPAIKALVTVMREYQKGRYEGFKAVLLTGTRGKRQLLADGLGPSAHLAPLEAGKL
jgi:hypothetical protein